MGYMGYIAMGYMGYIAMGYMMIARTPTTTTTT